eukprot:sb/3472781/
MEKISVRHHLTEEEEDQMRSFFQKFDVDENGMLDTEELRQLFINFNVVATAEDISEFLTRVDRDDDGTIDYDEFMTLIEDIMSENYSAEEVIEAFNLIDEDASGDVTLDEVASALGKADVEIPPEDMKNLLETADINRDGRICFSEFRTLIQSQCNDSVGP